MPIPDFQRANIKELFSMYDEKAENKIPSEKLRLLLRSLGVRITSSEVRDILVEIGNPDFIEFNTVLSVIEKYGESLLDLDEYRIAFSLLENQDTGHVTAESLIEAYKQIGQTVQPEKAEELIQLTSLFGRRNFNLQDFIVHCMRK